MANLVQSNFKGKIYKVNGDAIRIINPSQAAFYWGNGCEPLDIYLSKNFTTNEHIIVHVFSRKETQETGVYDKWCKRKEEQCEDGLK